MTKTHTSSNDGVCNNCFPCSVFRKTHRVSLSPTASAHSVQIPISCGTSVINPPSSAASQTPAPPQGNGTVKSTGESKPAAEIAAGIKKNDAADDDEGFSGYIDRAKAKIRASSTFKIGEKKEGIMPKTKTNRLDTLNYKVTNYINRTKLNIRRAPSTPN